MTPATAITVGLPRALLYHKYHVLWTTFLEQLGCRVVVSPATNRRIMQRGVELAVDESCLSMKVFLGHVDALRGKCDAVLVPRLGSVRKHEDVCVKFMGAHDIVANTMPDVRLLGYDVDVESGLDERSGLLGLARELGAGPWESRRAYRAAKAAQAVVHEGREREQAALLAEASVTDLRVLVVGHTYNLGDALIGMPILEFLRREGVEVLESDRVDLAHARSLSANLSPTMKWTFNKELLGAIDMYRDRVDGIIFLVTFPCGPDSLMAELCQRRLKEVPVATFVLDELAGEGGLRTRLESFVDILRMRKAVAT